MASQEAPDGEENKPEEEKKEAPPKTDKLNPRVFIKIEE